VTRSGSSLRRQLSGGVSDHVEGVSTRSGGSGLGQLLGIVRQNSGSQLFETYHCEFCQEKHKDADTKTIVLERCGHKLCEEMFAGWLESKVRDAAVHPVCFCRNEGSDHPCGLPISDKDIQNNLNEEFMEKFERFRCSLDNPNLRECPKCSNSQPGDPKKVEMVCENQDCKTAFCFEHGGAHPGKTCGEYELQHRIENKMNKAYINDKTKNCPKCQAKTEKNAGCNAMTCIRCRTGW
jgi:hypothetical protein